MSEIPEDIREAASRALRLATTTARLNNTDGAIDLIAKAILAERTEIANAALKHLIDLVECLDWWRDDPHDREFPADELIDARDFIASLAPKEA